MKTTTKKLSDTKIEIKVTLDKKDLAVACEKAIANLAKEIKVEGFRKGKVPTEVAKKTLDPNDIANATIDIAVRTTVPSAFATENKQPLVIPNVNVTKYVPEEMAEYTATADILPEIKLGDYKNLKVKKLENKVTKKDIDDILNNIQSAYAEKKATKKKAELSDEVIIDFTGKKDGVAFKGGAAKDYPLTLGSHSFIPGFEEGIVGHEPGDSFILELTFPKDYGEKSLAGQKTTFDVLLKQVNQITKPVIDDALAQKCGPFKTLDELKKDIEKNITMQNEHKINEQYKDELVAELVKKSKVSAPEILISDQLRLIKDDISRNAASRGMSLEDAIKSSGQTMEEWEKEATEVAEARVKASLILQILANTEKITTSDEEVAAKLAELREVYKKSAEAIKNLKDPRVKNDIKNRMTIDKTLDFLVKVNS